MSQETNPLYSQVGTDYKSYSHIDYSKDDDRPIKTKKNKVSQAFKHIVY